MATSLRLAVFAFAPALLLPSTSFAQVVHGGHGRPMTPTQVADHLRGYYAGNHMHGGYGYAGGAGYGYSGGWGTGWGGYRPTYGGGFFFPGYGNTYGLYPYGAGYNFSPPNYAPPPALTGRYPLSMPHTLELDAATGLPLLPSTSQSSPPTAPRTLPLAGSKVAPLAAAPSSLPVQPTAPPTSPPAVATVRILLPDGSATVHLDGKATTSQGRERTYVSPPLEAGKYTYSVVAAWSQDGSPMRVARTAHVSPGETTVIDFTRAENADAAPPANVDPDLASAPTLPR